MSIQFWQSLVVYLSKRRGHTMRPDHQMCDAKVGDAWQRVSLADAGGIYRTALKRCPACHGPVMINGGYSSSTARRQIVHRKSHSGCPLKPSTYTGTPSPHPQALA